MSEAYRMMGDRWGQAPVSRAKQEPVYTVHPTGRRGTWPLRDVDKHPSRVRPSAVLPEEDPLPGSQRQPCHSTMGMPSEVDWSVPP